MSDKNMGLSEQNLLKVLRTSTRVAYKQSRAATAQRKESFLNRRPHRTFRLTKRRDYRRSLKLPGYIQFTFQVHQMLWENRRIFIWMILVYGILTAAFVGLLSQESYSILNETVQETADEVSNGQLGAIGTGLATFFSTVIGVASGESDGMQQFFTVFISLLVWLTTVWLLRAIMAGKQVKVRDGLYNAGAPIVPMIVVSLFLLLQLVPAGIAGVGISAALSTGLLNDGIQAMLFWLAASLLVILSLYWVTATVMALVVVTIPGIYPLRAMAIAGDMVVGRRIRLLMRFIWLGILVVGALTLIMLPIILFDTWIKGAWPAIDWLPIVPISLLLTMAFLIVWSASYIFILYRKVADDDSRPA